jgi:serine/threonine protein kinase
LNSQLAVRLFPSVGCPMSDPHCHKADDIMLDSPHTSEEVPKELERTGPYIEVTHPANAIAEPDCSSDEVHPGWLGRRYEVHEEVARGGMGVVYRATDHAFDREVAVKVVRRKFAGSAVADRFLAEAKITGRLQHPGVPACHDIGTLSDGRPFLVIKLIRGQTLAEHLATASMNWAAAGARSADLPDKHSGIQRVLRKARRRLYDCLFWRVDSVVESPTAAEITAANPPALLWFIGLFERICQATAYAHSRNVVHRDLKPLNIMVGEFGEVQVMDWGLAKNLAERAVPGARAANGPAEAPVLVATGDEAPGRTLAGFPIGSPAYMPPEQARGELERIDKRSDVFALGAILCELLTGTPPYLGTVSEVISQAKAGNVEAAFERLSATRVEKELITLAKRCLAADPADRPADASAVSQAVGAYLGGLTDRLKRADRRQAEAVGRTRERFSAIGLIATALITLAGIAYWTWEKGWLTQPTETKAPPVKAPADHHIKVDLMRAKLRKGGPSGQRLANLPDEVLLQLIQGDLTETDLAVILMLQDRRAEPEAKKEGHPDARKPDPASIPPRK